MDKNDNLDDLSFEQALTKLEEIVESLSTGSGNLDEMVRLYEAGIKYLNGCKTKLEEAETKISILSQDLPKLKDKEDENGL